MSSGCGSSGGATGGGMVSASADGRIVGAPVIVSNTFGSITTASLFLSLGSCESIIMDEMLRRYHEMGKVRTSFETSVFLKWTHLNVAKHTRCSSGKVSVIY